jgi:8-oxo-dGTP diphosphatase
MSHSHNKYAYSFPRPALTVDVAIVTGEHRPRVLLVRRKHPPFAGAWALPGGFVDEGETLEEAGRRELREETGLDVKQLRQLQAFGDPGRDPRGWTVSVVFVGRANPAKVQPRAKDDAAEAAWHSLARPPALAFDHAAILAVVRRRLRKSV